MNHCIRQILAEIDKVGVDVSLDWNHRRSQVQPRVEGGEVVLLTIIPEVVTAKIGFTAKISEAKGCRVELEASGATSELCRDAALSTLRLHQEIFVRRSPPESP